MDLTEYTARPAVETEFEMACDIFAASFFEDPWANFLFPDSKRRTKYLPVFFSITAVDANILIAGDYDGAAAYYLPEQLDLSTETMLKQNEQIYEACGPDAPTVVRGFNALTINHPRDLAPHVYTFLFAARPKRRGLTGPALVRGVNKVCDKAGLPWYGEATTLRNRALYMRFGTRPLTSYQIEGGPEIFPIWRDPGAKAYRPWLLEEEAK